MCDPHLTTVDETCSNLIKVDLSLINVHQILMNFDKRKASTVNQISLNVDKTSSNLIKLDQLLLALITV